MKITGVESFRVEVPVTEAQRQLRCQHSAWITRVTTDEGVTGYGFGKVEAAAAAALLVGRDPHAIERHLADGLGAWYPAENALWDLVGKAAGLPLHKLFGTFRRAVPVYLTCVWPGRKAQADVTPRQQAEDIARYAEAGYRAVKIQIWRPDPMQDVEVVRLVRERVGGPERMEVMLDRTGEYSGSTWDYATALRFARALEAVDATWLEEPFERGDITLSARLRAEVDIPITGGEHQPLAVYAPYIKGEAFDIIQPHCANVFAHLRQIAAMAELSGVECIFHGSHGFDLVGALQLAASIRTCRILEVVYTTPPSLPQEAWAPLDNLVRGGRLFEVVDGAIPVPSAPGLGVDLDEQALARYRVE